MLANLRKFPLFHFLLPGHIGPSFEIPEAKATAVGMSNSFLLSDDVIFHAKEPQFDYKVSKEVVPCSQSPDFVTIDQLMKILKELQPKLPCSSNSRMIVALQENADKTTQLEKVNQELAQTEFIIWLHFWVNSRNWPTSL